MITAEVNGRVYRVHHAINRGGWFKKTWLVGIGMGFSTSFFLVEGDNENDVVDTFVDSKYGHLVIITENENQERGEGFQCYAGNNGLPVNLDEMRVLARCKVNYFASKNLNCVQE